MVEDIISLYILLTCHGRPLHTQYMFFELIENVLAGVWCTAYICGYDVIILSLLGWLSKKL